jgi:hypothetical protein
MLSKHTAFGTALFFHKKRIIIDTTNSTQQIGGQTALLFNHLACQFRQRVRLFFVILVLFGAMGRIACIGHIWLERWVMAVSSSYSFGLLVRNALRAGGFHS